MIPEELRETHLESSKPRASGDDPEVVKPQAQAVV